MKVYLTAHKKTFNYQLSTLQQKKMKDKLLKIASFGIKPDTSPEIAEQTKLVNMTSLLGVPISIIYVILFSFTGAYHLAIAFTVGFFVFLFPPFLNKWFGLDIGRYFIFIMVGVVFGTVNIIAGKEAGFYLGFLVISVPPIFCYPDFRRGILFVSVILLFLILSIIGNIMIEPTCPLDYAMAIYLFNLFIVFVTSITVIVIFKTELKKSR